MEGDQASGEEEEEEAKPERFIPCVDVSFEITAPPTLPSGHFEASPLLDEPAHANPAHLEKLRRELAQPHSVLSLRIKEELEKVIAAEGVRKGVVVVPRVIQDRDYSKQPTTAGVLNLRSHPTTTGGAYMMRGPNPAEAPFMGFRHEFTGTKVVSVGDTSLPGKYQPYCAESQHPHGRTEPSAQAPTGTFRPPPEGRVFQVVRHGGEPAPGGAK